MCYLVTGGAGFIGSNTVDELVRRSHNVRESDFEFPMLKCQPVLMSSSDSSLEAALGQALSMIL
jgi:nucleoside-diphosphate-sugar epimerase